MPEKAVDILDQADAVLESPELRRFEPIQMLLVLPLRTLELRQHLFGRLGRASVRQQPPNEFLLTSDNRRAVAHMPPDHFDFCLALAHRSPLWLLPTVGAPFHGSIRLFRIRFDSRGERSRAISIR
ncbi:hypothetical protein CI1B_40840 [Bradyrhizobium ivorense]|uniref:Uncharacterized protein n=1 Tax=Bradyrhizobium ivorense TaxID=2511166 RepID=A0A508TC99_9BRAD|nr:hypothetical protein CI1B_40840 [Bradyrhizobium ivorense]